MKLGHFNVLVAISERGSLRGAARQLGMTQPAMTRSIRELERELGVQLFERSSSGVVPTSAGKSVTQHARAIQLEMQHTLEDVQRFKGVENGTLSLALSTAAHVAILPKIFAPFRRRYPNVRLKIIEGLFPALEAAIREGEIDAYVGPVPNDLRSRGLVTDVLFENPRIIVGRRGHPLGDATSIAELVDACWLSTPVMPNTENEVNAIYEAAGLPSPRIVAQATSGMSIISVVASSDLLAPAPREWLDLIPSTNLLMRIPIRETTLAPPICAVRLERTQLSPAAQYLNDLIRRAASNHARRLAETIARL